MPDPIKHTGDNFLILRQTAQGRAGVMRLSRRLVGREAAAFPAFTLVYSRPEQFADYLAKRLILSTQLARLAHYFVFLCHPTGRLHVAGAHAQHGTGIAGAIDRDPQGRVVYSGYDAAHVRLGSYYCDGQAVNQAWYRYLEGVLRASGNPVGAIRQLLPVNCELINIMTMFEATTDQTDALSNRVFGQLESALHAAMRNLIMPATPATLAEFGPALQRFSAGLPRLLAVMLKRVARTRLREITQEPRKEQMQAAAGPRMFASESAMLRALIDQVEQPNSGLWRELSQSQNRADNDIRDELEDVRLAQEELAALGA